MLICVYQKTYTIMFLKALFVIVQTGNDSNANNRKMRNELWHIHTMEYYTPIRKKCLTSTYIMDEFYKHYAEQNKLHAKEHLLYDSM